MATWKLTPDTGQVTGTHTDMPLAVIPSALEMGAITLAEAQSSRFYSDVDLTTELAREVVSADEIHVKVPSASSSTEIWMDFDGVRTDYAVGATYGRNAVWSGYKAKYHLNDVNDSTGNAYTLTNVGTVPFNPGLIDDAADGGTGNSTKWLRVDNDLGITNGAITMTVWVKMNAEISTGTQAVLMKGDSGTNVMNYISYDYNGGTRRIIWNRQRQNTANDIITFNATLGTTNWNQIVYTYDGSNLRGYLNGSLVAGPTAYSGNGAGAGIDIFEIMGHNNIAGNPQYSVLELSGLADETSVLATALSANWITTEYNNQNDNAAFWVAVEEAAGSSIKSIGGLAKADIKSMAEIIIG